MGARNTAHRGERAVFALSVALPGYLRPESAMFARIAWLHGAADAESRS